MDVKYMHGKFYGVTGQEIIGEFGEGRSFVRTDELLFYP